MFRIIAVMAAYQYMRDIHMFYFWISSPAASSSRTNYSQTERQPACLSCQRGLSLLYCCMEGSVLAVIRRSLAAFHWLSLVCYSRHVLGMWCREYIQGCYFCWIWIILRNLLPPEHPLFRILMLLMYLTRCKSFYKILIRRNAFK